MFIVNYEENVPIFPFPFSDIHSTDWLNLSNFHILYTILASLNIFVAIPRRLTFSILRQRFENCLAKKRKVNTNFMWIFHETWTRYDTPKKIHFSFLLRLFRVLMKVAVVSWRRSPLADRELSHTAVEKGWRRKKKEYKNNFLFYFLNISNLHAKSSSVTTIFEIREHHQLIFNNVNVSRWRLESMCLHLFYVIHVLTLSICQPHENPSS